MASISMSPRDRSWSEPANGAENSITVKSTTGTTTFYGRFLLTYGYSGPGSNSYYVKNITLQMRKSNSSNEGSTVTFSNNKCTFTGFSSSSSSPYKPYGNVVLASQISTSWTTVLYTGSYNVNSTIKADGSDASASITTQVNLEFKVSSTSTRTIQIYGNFDISCQNLRRTFTCYNEDWSVYKSLPTVYGGSVTLPSVPNKSPGRGGGSYYVSFNPAGGSPTPETKWYEWSYPITYTGGTWGSYSGGQSVRLTENLSGRATYQSNDGPITYKTIGSLPNNVKKVGYRFKEWLWNGSPISASQQVNTNINLVASWIPKEYNVRYETSGLKFEGSNHKPSNFRKTYGDSQYLETDTSPSRIGYKFDGWYHSESKKLYAPGAAFDDTCYNKINSADSNSDVILTAKWTAIPNTIKFHYYIDNSSEKVDTGTYTIEDSTYSKGSPNQVRGGDYVFLGWSQTRPVDWTTTRGVYIMSDEAPECETPVVIDNIKSIKDWGTTSHYYGFWSVTGKYIKIGKTWLKCNMMYIKTQEQGEYSPTWKRVNNIYVKTASGWKHEVGRN